MAQRDWLSKDYYKILGVSKSATKTEIKKAYRKLAQRYHPDANEGDDAAEARFKEVSEAHAVLTNDAKRKEYDEIRAYAGASGGRPFGFDPSGGGRVRYDVGDVQDLFGGGGGLFEDLFGFRPRGPQKGPDAETSAELTFEDAVWGTQVELSDGTKVRIPPGVTNGSRIRVPGKGAPGEAGASSGDLFVKVSVRPHEIFELAKGGNLKIELPLSFAEAAAGARVEVPTLDGSVTLKVPPGTQHGKTLRVRGKGSPRPGGGRGDLLVTVRVEIPQKLTKDQKRLLEEFEEAGSGSPRGHLESYLKRRVKAP